VYNPVQNLIIQSHNIKFYELERLDFDWNEHIDGYLTACQNYDSDSDNEIGAEMLILTPLETLVILVT